MAPPHIFLHVTNNLINVAVYSVFSFEKAKQIKNNVSCKHICGGAIWNSFSNLILIFEKVQIKNVNVVICGKKN